MQTPRGAKSAKQHTKIKDAMDKDGVKTNKNKNSRKLSKNGIGQIGARNPNQWHTSPSLVKAKRIKQNKKVKQGTESTPQRTKITRNTGETRVELATKSAKPRVLS